MRKNILYLVSIFMLISCGNQYDSEIKLVIQGKLIDSNGNPIANKRIDINVGGNYGIEPLIIGSSSDLISYGNTDSNGNFLLFFPLPYENLPIEISIIKYPENVFLDKSVFARKNNFKNYKLDLKTITLNKQSEVTNLTILYQKTSVENIILKDVIVEGLKYENYVDLNFIPEENQYQVNDYQVLKNQPMVLKYKTIDFSNNPAGNIINHSETIAIANEPIIFTITY